MENSLRLSELWPSPSKTKHLEPAAKQPIRMQDTAGVGAEVDDPRKGETADLWGGHVKAFWLHPLFLALLSMLTTLQPESGKVAVVNPEWRGHYWIPPHTSNEYGYSQTGLCARAHSQQTPICPCDGTCGSILLHHAGDSTATKAWQHVPTNISTDETF